MENKQKNISFVSRRAEPSSRELLTNARPSFYGIGFLVALVAVSIFGYAFLFSIILKKEDAVVEAVNKLDLEQLREERLYALRDSFRATEKERGELERYFIAEDEIVTFIEDIEQAGRRANVSLRFNVVNIRNAEQILALEFETLGSFNELFYFLQLVEHIPAKISLERFLFDKEIPRTMEKRKDSDTWHAIFTLAILSFNNF